MPKRRQRVQHLPFLILHDNVNIPFRIFSQQLDNQSYFDLETAATNRTLQEFRAVDRKEPLTVHEIYALEKAAVPSCIRCNIHHVLQYLTECLEFDFATYSQRNNSMFTPPSPIQQLSYGLEYVSEQHMLPTLHIKESSYDGTDKLIPELLRQLYIFQGQDNNSFEQMDWLVILFRWFHLVMAFANSLTAGHGLMHTFTLLEKKGLNTVQTRGPFHQNLHDAICHVIKAHFCTC
ncbi:hypothetical protein F5I97DRAFT_1933785 [Phlebopus sp. FC_14]|nr:hypothetical protein F5I97DRAFT_1933785 [Phlebopus sp. FC_14]